MVTSLLTLLLLLCQSTRNTDTDLIIELSVVDLLLLDNFPHLTGHSSPSEIQPDHNPIHKQNHTHTEQYNKIALSRRPCHIRHTFNITAKNIVRYPHIRQIQSQRSQDNDPNQDGGPKPGVSREFKSYNKYNCGVNDHPHEPEVSAIA
jgi:hypothetical protein